MTSEVFVNDITILLLATGFALLIAILALKNEIQIPRKEVRTYENLIMRKVSDEEKELFQILSEMEQKVLSNSNLNEYELDLMVGALFKIYGKKDVLTREQTLEGLKILKTLQNSKKLITNLERCYEHRYTLVFSLTVISFFSGVISLLLDIIRRTEKEYLLLIVPLIIIGFLLHNLYRGNNIEKELMEDYEEYENYLQTEYKLIE